MIALNLTSIGASHIRSGKECQDFSLSECTDNYSLAITCDGHGGDNYFRSALGSCFAAQAASACITELLFDISNGYFPKNPEAMLVQLEKSIIAHWNAAVWDHYEANPFTKEELGSVSENRREKLLLGKYIESTYGTTLIALVLTKDFWFGVQIGDGKCVRIKKDGTFDSPIPANDKCFLNSTTSICDENAIDDFRHYYSEDAPAALFCGSDGVDDSFITEGQLYKLYATIARSYGLSEYDQASAELEDYMPRLSQKGSGDDVSIAGIIDETCIIEAVGEQESVQPKEEIARVWLCTKCGSINTTKFCGECGEKRPSLEHAEEDIKSKKALLPEIDSCPMDEIENENICTNPELNKEGDGPSYQDTESSEDQKSECSEALPEVEVQFVGSEKKKNCTSKQSASESVEVADGKNELGQAVDTSEGA